MESDGFNLVFNKDDKNNIKVTYNEYVCEDIRFNEEIIQKLNELSQFNHLSITKLLGDRIHEGTQRRIGLYVQKAFTEALEEQYNYMKEKQKEEQKK